MSTNITNIVVPFPEIEADMLEYAVWNCPKLEHGEEVHIRHKETKTEFKGFFHEEEFSFYIGADGCIKAWDCQWRRICPELVMERAANNYLAMLKAGNK